MPAAGESFGPYALVAPIGAGGMGEVWRARDSRLQRDVALKVLTAGSVLDLRQRFELEARAASALQHPNIVAVYDVGTSGDLPYIVSEFVEGETLRTILTRGPVPLRRALELGAQIADGLAAAHAAGITHRDLKPENVVITPEGRAKILDFGLAKLTPAAARRGDNSTETYHSGPGLLLGTANYMSPEQARGHEVDFRSDQFSFGIVLFELLSGRQPFRRDSTAQTMTAIIEDEPGSPGSQVPVPLRWVLERCLEKEPAQRYASTADLFRDLRHIRGHLTDLSAQSAPLPVRPKSLVGWVAGAAAILAALAAGLAGGGAEPLDPVTLTPFAVEPEAETSPAFSPDGRSIAYWKAGNQIWVRPVDTPAPVMVAEGANGRPVWSPDSTKVCYRAGREFWCVSAAGGPAVRLLPEAGLSARFTPDGKALVFVRPNGEQPSLLFRSEPPGAEPVRVETVELPLRTDSLLNFTQDGSKLAVRTVTQELWVTAFPSGKAQRIGHARGSTFDWFPDGRHAVISAESERFQALHLIDTQGSARRLLLRGAESVNGVSLSPDGRKLVYATGLSDADVIEYGMDGKPVRTLAGTTSQEVWPSWSPVDERFVYVSYAGRNPTLMTRAADGGAPVTLREVTGARQGPTAPVYSPDGRRIAYWVGGELQTIPANGGQPVTVATVPGPANEICWAPDGATIWFSQPGRLMRVGSLGGQAEEVKQARGGQMACSPDGAWLSYPARDGLHLFAPASGEDRILLPAPIPFGRVQFGERGKVLYYLTSEGRELVTYEIPSGRRLRSVPVQAPPGELAMRFSVHKDGKRLLVQGGRAAFDLWIAEGFAQPAPAWRRWFQPWVVPESPQPDSAEPF